MKVNYIRFEKWVGDAICNAREANRVIRVSRFCPLFNERVKLARSARDNCYQRYRLLEFSGNDNARKEWIKLKKKRNKCLSVYRKEQRTYYKREIDGKNRNPKKM